jgi:hypothetical protein
MEQQQRQTGPQQLRMAAGWLAFIARMLANSVEVFLHKGDTFGERYLGMPAGAAVLAICLYAGCWPGHDLSFLFLFLFAYLFMCPAARIGVSARQRRGDSEPHSYYTGRPWIMRLTGRMSEQTVKSTIEPLIVFLVAVFTMPVSEPLGGYLLLASLGLLASTSMSAGFDRKRQIDMHDAFIEQRDLAERFRGMRRD